MKEFINGEEVFPIRITCVYQPYRVKQLKSGKLKTIQVGWPHTTSHGAYKALEECGCDEEEYHVRSIPIIRNTDLERKNALHFS